jgi:hypothetical protein
MLIRRLALATIAAATLLSAGCGQQAYDNERGKGDAPVDRQTINDGPAQVMNMPDGFPNLATKCVPFQKGKRYYAGTESDVPVIVDDPRC